MKYVSDNYPEVAKIAITDPTVSKRAEEILDEI